MDRRQTARDKVTYSGVAEIGEAGEAKHRVVRDVSEYGASIQFGNAVRLFKEPISLRIAQKGRSFLARIIWWRNNFVGVAFSDTPPARPTSDLDERLRQSQAKKRQLQRRINELLDKR
jgi:PilZ domain